MLIICYIQKNQYTLESPKAFSNEAYFTESEFKNILNNKNNKNIYYLIFDGADPLKTYNDHIGKVDVEKIVFELEKLDFTYIDDVASSYDLTKYTLSQILNLNYFINENNPPSHPSMMYPSIMIEFEQSILAKILKRINYDFFWIGNIIDNCIYYNVSLCLPHQKEKNFFDLHVKTARYLIDTNYVLRNFLKKTPISDINNKVFFWQYERDLGREIVYYENDGVKKFIEFSNDLKKK